VWRRAYCRVEIGKISNIFASSFVSYRKQEHRLYCAGIAVYIVLSRIPCRPAPAGSLVCDIKLIKIFPFIIFFINIISVLLCLFTY
jgi:hypothetical protein